MRVISFLVFTIAGLIIASPFDVTPSAAAGPGQNNTPSSSYAALFEPWQFSTGTAYADDWALMNQGYVVSTHENPESTMVPDPMIEEFVDELDSLAGAIVYVGHGDAAGVSIEVYGNMAGNEMQALWRLEQLQPLYPGQLFLACDPETSGIAIAMRWWAIPQYVDLSDAIVDLECCCSEDYWSWSAHGARVEFVNDCGLSPSAIATNMGAIWGGFDGSGGWEKRTASRAAGDASSYLTLNGNGKTTLAPCVKWTNAEKYDRVPLEGKTVRLLFDTHIDTTVTSPPVFWVDGESLELVGQPWWDSDTTLATVVKAVPGIYGAADLVVDHEAVRSLTNAAAKLDGVGSGGRSDWRIPLTNDNIPAAEIEGVIWQEGTLYWNPVTEHQTAAYRVEGRNPPDRRWWPVKERLSTGVGRRSCSVGNAYAEYRLIEQEHSGNEIIHQSVSAKNMPEVSPQQSPAIDALRAALRMKLASGPANPGTARQQVFYGEKLGILTPQQFVDELSDLRSYLQGYFGMTVQIVAVEQFGPPEARYLGIKGAIGAMYGQGYHYFLLVGDASDWEYFDGPHTSEYWPPGWEGIRQYYFACGYPHGGNPQYNIIPTVVVKDPLPREENLAWYQPYYMLNDMIAYGDVDDDGLPDAVVTRWPFTTDVEVAAMTLKLLTYLDAGGAYSHPYIVSTYLGDVNHQQAGDGERAVQTADAILSCFPSGTTFHELLESQYSGWDRVVAAVELWHREADIVLFVGSTSGRYAPATFFYLGHGFTTGLISVESFTPFVLAVSCGTGDEYRTEDPVYGSPVSHRFLAAHAKGAIAWVGATAGTFQSGNRVVGQKIVQYLQADAARPAGESVRLAIRDVLENPPPSDPGAVTTCKSYNFFGFGLAPLNHHREVVAVQDSTVSIRELPLSLSVPNPIIGRDKVVFNLAAKCEAQLCVYDVVGRLVAALADGVFEAGPHTIVWGADGKVSSGSYFLKLSALGRSVTRNVQVFAR